MERGNKLAILQALKRICIEDDEETILANSKWGTVREPGTTGYTNPTSWPSPQPQMYEAPLKKKLQSMSSWC